MYFCILKLTNNDANLPNPAPAVELAAGFTVCHLVFGVVNYL